MWWSSIADEVGVMDLYLRGDSDNFNMPNDQKTTDIRHAHDRSPSPSVLPQWKVGQIEKFVPPDELVNRSVKPIGAGLNLNWQSLNENFDLESSLCDGEFSSNQSAYGHFALGDSCATNLEASFYEDEYLDDLPYCQLQSSMEQMDDFWESVFTEDSPNVKNLSNSFDPAYRSMSFGNQSADMFMVPCDSLKDTSFMGRRSGLKRKFTPIDIGAEDKNQVEDVSPPYMVTDNSMSPEGSPMASVLSVLVPAELTTSNEIVSSVQEKKCPEATILWELEDVTSQLNMEMRVCFRDALYRLAKVSKQHHSFVKDKPSSGVDGKSSCLGSSESAETKTNAIDRIVAYLMFNKPNFGLPGLSCPGSVHQSVGSCQNSRSYDDILDEPVIHSCHHHLVSLPCDVEASTCTNENSSCSHEPGGAMDYISDMSSPRAEELVAIVDQFWQKPAT